MGQSTIRLSARSYLIAGLSAAVVGTAVVNPVTLPTLNPAKSASAAVALSSITTPIELAIKNTYDFVEPWVAYGFELTQYVLSFIPAVWWVAPAIDLGYFTIEPLVQAGVFVLADVIGLDFAQIWPDITAGVSESVTNAVDYALAWLGSLVPLPPFPPFPPGPFASVPAGAEAALLAAPAANSITTPIENAIKNSYDFVEGWANYGMQWASYALGLIPVVNWFTPAIPLVYNTIEPLVQGGVYSFADLIGFNWGAIGPEIWNGITTSVNNAIQGIRNWINIPFPPIPPLRAAGAAGLRAAAAVKPADVATEEIAEADTGSPVAEVEAPVADAKAEKAKSATPAVETPAVASTGVTEPAEAPAVEAAAPVSVTVPEAVEEPADAEAPQPARTARRGHNAPVNAAATADTTTESSVRAERPGRTSRAHSNSR